MKLNKENNSIPLKTKLKKIKKKKTKSNFSTTFRVLLPNNLLLNINDLVCVWTPRPRFSIHIFYFFFFWLAFVDFGRQYLLL